MHTLTTKQLATYLGVTQRTIQRKGKREHWPFKTRKAIGGERHCYVFETLSIIIRQQIIEKIITNFDPHR